jgi:roadblock/LC7 domain-containing protein
LVVSVSGFAASALAAGKYTGATGVFVTALGGIAVFGVMIAVCVSGRKKSDFEVVCLEMPKHNAEMVDKMCARLGTTDRAEAFRVAMATYQVVLRDLSDAYFEITGESYTKSTGDEKWKALLQPPPRTRRASRVLPTTCSITVSPCPTSAGSGTRTRA